MINTDLTGQVLRASWAVADAAPDTVRRMARLCLTDWVGVALAGAREPVVRVLVDDALEASGVGAEPLIGRSERFALRDAVLINGAAGHALDYDDGLPAMSGHPSAPIVPALLGLAAARRLDGAVLLEAMIAAIEVAGRVGRLVAPDHYERGFHATGTVGALAAAAGCARLLSLDLPATSAALGLAGTRAAGLKAAFGSDGKPLHAGWAALVGLTAASWAARGMTGPQDILGARQGFAVTHGASFHRDRALAPAPEGAYVMGVRFKRHAACAGTHSTLDAAGRLARHIGLRPASIARVTIRIDRRADDVCNIARPRSGLEAKFSLRTVTAMVLAGVDTADPGSFTDAVVGAPDLVRLRDRIQVELQDGWAPSATEVIVETTDGGLHQETVAAADHETDGEALVRQIETKMLTLAAPVVGSNRAGDLLSSIRALDTMGSVADLAEALRA